MNCFNAGNGADTDAVSYFGAGKQPYLILAGNNKVLPAAAIVFFALSLSRRATFINICTRCSCLYVIASLPSKCL